ncbi:hypothetical protein BHM03_00018762 [Ensete ventricosum]|nr:hypothetical protein BHM03_00018762 [Ensete ventricosum]
MVHPQGKRSIRKKVEGKPMCAFDLLATVAGKLLSERENSLTSCDNTGTSDPAAAKGTIKQEQIDSNERPIKFEAFDLLSCNDEHSKSSKATSSGPTSPIVKSEISDEDAIGGESKFIEDGCKIGCSVAAVAENFDNVRLSSSSMESHGCKDGSKKLPQGQQQTAGNALYSLDGPVGLDAKPSVLGSSDSSVEVPLHRNNISRNTSSPKQEDGMDLAACNDDDENSSGCTHPTVVTNKTSRMQHIGHRRIKKLLASKSWRVAPTMLQDSETSNYVKLSVKSFKSLNKYLVIFCAFCRISPIIDQGGPDATQFLQMCPESDHDSVPSPTDAASSPEKTKANSLALVAVPPMDTEALAMVPLRNKPKRSEATQRRVRRPFSVAEVEALVQAVEKLGTGRWRDVKLCAFENAKHRTYVDLKVIVVLQTQLVLAQVFPKVSFYHLLVSLFIIGEFSWWVQDKWKTLVHTARISPQQRRGEPVPQELLDRVLSAQAYWSQQQAKLLLKPPSSAETRLLL